MKHKLIIHIRQSRPLTDQEQTFFSDELDEWLIDHFQHWDDNPFGDMIIKHPLR